MLGNVAGYINNVQYIVSGLGRKFNVYVLR